jgi:putative endonuclease
LPRPNPRHALSRELGRKAESLVADYLLARGFTLLAENLRVGRLEVDLLARLGPVVVIVEVRMRGRGSFLPALSTLSKAKRERLLRAADLLWQRRFAHQADIERIRIDVAAVFFDDGPPRVEYFEGAIAHLG